MKRLVLTACLLPALALTSSCNSYGMKDSATSLLSLPLRLLGSMTRMFSSSAGTAASD